VPSLRAPGRRKLNTLGNQDATNVLSFRVGGAHGGAARAARRGCGTARWRALPASRATIGAHGGP
jgi:hypothetical protein